jgi:hypothetical protein
VSVSNHERKTFTIRRNRYAFRPAMLIKKKGETSCP